MYRRHLLITIGLFFIVVIMLQAITYRLEKKTRILADENQQNVSVSALIGEHQFILFGYSSPQAKITLDGEGISEQTTADKQGYFIFNKSFSPLSPREACLTAQDQLGRITSPVCLPPIPANDDASIGPVIMSPTISLDRNYYYSGDEIVLSGQTIPLTNVSFSTFIDEKRSIFDYLTPSVYAYTFPQLTSLADAKGNFSLSIPSSHPQFFRLFTQTDFQNFMSPDSVKLSLTVMPIWMVIVQFFLLIFSLIKSRLLEFIIAAEFIGVAIYLLRRYLHPRTIAANRALAIRELSTIVKEDTTLVKA